MLGSPTVYPQPTGPQSVTVRTQPYHEALHAARQHQPTPEFHQEYAIRAGIESSIAQGVRVAELRRTRYVGLEKTIFNTF